MEKWIFSERFYDSERVTQRLLILLIIRRRGQGVTYEMLRKKASAIPSEDNDRSNNERESESLLLGINTRGYFGYNGEVLIGCPDLIAVKECRHGICYKKNNSLLSYLFPCIFEKWKQRYLVLVGNYIYRFENKMSTKTKGVPIPLDSARIARDAISDSHVIIVKTIRKSYLFRFDTEEQAESWFTAMKERKLKSIQERMGHSPISKEVDMYNKKAEALFARVLKLEIKTSEEEDRRNPMIFGVP